jgi:sec-independent protein translocase protein TatA
MNYLTIDTLAMWTPGPLEIVIIGIITIVIFGKRLPEIARGLGKSLTEFKRGVKEAKDSKNELVNDAKEVKNDLVN